MSKTNERKHIEWFKTCKCECKCGANVCNINPANIRLDEGVLKTSSRRLDQDEYVCFSLTSSEDVFLQDALVKTNTFVLAIRLQAVFKTFSRSSRRLAKTSLRRFQNVLPRRLQDVLKNVFKCKTQVSI